MNFISVHHKSLILLIIGVCLCACNKQTMVEIRGDQKKWHRITLVFDGPPSSEMAEENPFLNYRHARTFFEDHIPFWKMEPADALTSDTSSRR